VWTTEFLIEAMRPMKLAVEMMVPVARCCQVRAWTPDGEWHLYFVEPHDLAERAAKRQAIQNWLRYKQASAITVLRLVQEPLGVMVVGLKHVDGEVDCKAVVEWCERHGNEMIFSGSEWIPDTDVEDGIVGLLPAHKPDINRQAMEALAAVSLAGHDIEISQVGRLSPARARLRNWHR